MSTQQDSQDDPETEDLISSFEAVRLTRQEHYKLTQPIPPIRVQELANHENEHLVYLPLSAPIHFIERCLRNHALGWSVWKSCGHHLVFLDSRRKQLDDKTKTLHDYGIRPREPIFFVPAPKRKLDYELIEPHQDLYAMLGDAFSITLKSLRPTGFETLNLTVRANYTIEIVQHKINSQLHVPVDDQRLVWKGKDLSRYFGQYSRDDEAKTLAELGFQDSDTIHVLHRREVSHAPCICWHLREYLEKFSRPWHELTPEILEDPVVKEIVERGPPPAYESGRESGASERRR